MFEFSVKYLDKYNVWHEITEWTRPIKNKSTLDESHDETQLFLSCSAIDKPFEPFTRFIINVTEKNTENEIINTETWYRVVVSDEIEQTIFNGEQAYNHDIRLAEATKELERYTVDNLSFTNEWNKAFKISLSNAYITNKVLSKDWYNYDNFWILKNTIIYYVNKFSGYNTYDRVSAENTMIGKTLYADSYIDDFNFSSIIKMGYQQSDIITIPSVTMSSVNTIKIAKDWDFLTAWLTDEYYAEFRQGTATIKLINPYGNETIVSAGDQVVLSHLGKYKLRYTLARQVRLYVQRTNTWSGSSWRWKESNWYDGVTTTLEFEFECMANDSEIPELSIYDILNKLVQVTPTRFADSSSTKYRLDTSIYTRYSNVKSPELIITNKNLWEALKEIGGLINAIPFLNIQDENDWNVIDYMPLSSEESVSDKVEENYCNSTSYYDSDNFTGSFDMTIDNMINPIDTKEGYIKSAGYHVAKTIRSEEAEISETSMDIETTYPIYKINSIKYVNYALNPTEYDLSEYVQEKALYDTLESNTENSGKAICLYYTQGKSNIYGLQYKISRNTYAAALNKVAIRKIIQIVANRTLTAEELLYGKFIVEYVPYLQARIKLFKTNAPKIGIDTAMFQNASANVIDARAVGRKNVAVIGRIGNLGYTDSIKVYSLDRIPLKGQRANDGYFVGTVFTEFDQHHILCSIEYTKDYQKINDYIGVQNLQRYFEVSEKQAIDRFVNTNMFYVFTGNDISVAEINKSKGLNQATGYPTKNYLASLLVDQGYGRKINGSILTAYSEKNNAEYVCSKTYLNTNAIAVGNSICLITDFMNNYGAGNQAKSYYDNVEETTAFMNKAVPYSDVYGRIKHIDIQNVTDSNIVYPTGNINLELQMSALATSLPAVTDLDSNNEPVPNSDKYVIADQYQNNNKPTFSLIGCKQDIELQKDSREIIRINQQHHFLTADDNIVVGSGMTECCRFIQDNTMKARLVFLRNKIDTYEFKIKDEDIIEIVAPGYGGFDDIANSLISLGTEITSYNLNHILSTTNNTDELYLLPNIQYGGAIVGLQEDAKAWAIITDENQLIIGKNENIKASNDQNYEMATQINMFVTSVY